MKVLVNATSSNYLKEKFIEVNSIDEALDKIRDDKLFVLSIIDLERSDLYHESEVHSPDSFVISFNTYNDDYDIEIEIYDTYRE